MIFQVNSVNTHVKDWLNLSLCLVDANSGQKKQDLIGVFICIFNFSVAGFILIMIET